MSELDEISSGSLEAQAPEGRTGQMSPEVRRGIVERVLARLDARGARFERDPQFLAEVEAWVEGRIDMQELRARYLAFARARWSNVPEQETELESEQEL
jgi:hypothetical protein